MKLFFISLLLLFACVGAAMATPVTAQQANAYYQSCLGKPMADVNKETQDIFCQCTATYMQKTMSVEDIKAAAGSDQAARVAMNKTMTQVYAPCMQFPVRDLINSECLKNQFQAKNNLCACLSDKMATFTAQQAQTYLADVLAKNPNSFDPMGAIMQRPEFQQKEKRVALECLTGK